jgi:hypothetical protein
MDAGSADRTNTTLDPILSAVPWEDDFQLSGGINAVTGVSAAIAVEPFTLIASPAYNTFESQRVIETESELFREIETSVSGDYNIQGVTVNASTEYLNSIRTSARSITLIAEYTVTTSGYLEADHYTLTPEAQQLLTSEGPENFRAVYGDYFISGVRKQSSFRALYVCRAESINQLNQFKASIGGSSPGVFTASGSAAFTQAAMNNSIQYEIYVYMVGASGSYIQNSGWSPDEVIQALNWFKKNHVGINFQAKLKHYSLLVNNFPTTVAISPEVFLQLRLTYTKVWRCNALFHNCPANYKKDFEAPTNALINGVVANQAILPSDPVLLAAYKEQATILEEGLQAVYNRRNFYYMLLQNIASHPEPEKGTEIDSGYQRRWVYGLIYNQDLAGVTLSLHAEDKSRQWEAGHIWQKDSFYFQDKERLIVGWEMLNHWGELNGTWTKVVDKIITTDTFHVNVESYAHRGFNWGVRVYHVPAKDYRFD